MYAHLEVYALQLQRRKISKTKLKNPTKVEYPKFVTTSALTISQRVRARVLGMAHIKGQLFLGYCGEHKKYFIDLIHTNSTIRCPTCDANWLYNFE